MPSETAKASLGFVTSYGAAKRGGYTGTYAEWCELMATVADHLEENRQIGVGAAAAKTAAEAAQLAAETAQGKAEDAQDAAEDAQAAAEAAQTGAETAETGAEAAQTAAEAAQTAAETAETGAETAQAAAEAAQAGAEAAGTAGVAAIQAAQATAVAAVEEAAEDITEEVAQIETNKEDIADLKTQLYDSTTVNYDVTKNATNTYPTGWRVAGIAKATGQINSKTVHYLIVHGALKDIQPGDVIALSAPNNPEGLTFEVYRYQSDGLDDYVDYETDVTEFEAEEGYYYRIQLGYFEDATDYISDPAFLASITITITRDCEVYAHKTYVDEEINTLNTEITNIYQKSYTHKTSIGQVKIIPDAPTNQPESLAFGDGKLIWAMDDSKAQSNNLRVYESVDGFHTVTNRKINHTLGHVNTIDYRDGALIFGNGGSGNYNGGTAQNPGNGYIYIINDFFTKFDDHYTNSTPMTLSDAIAIEFDVTDPEFSGDSKYNVIFGESNIPGSHNAQNSIIYLITSTLGENKYNTKIRKMMLGKGEYNLGNGTFIENTPDDEFNGTWKILATYTGASDGTDFCNDIAFINGKIVMNAGETKCNITTIEFDEDNNTYLKKFIKWARYNEDGTERTSWTSGICYDIANDNVFIGFAGSGGVFIYPSASLS